MDIVKLPYWLYRAIVVTNYHLHNLLRILGSVPLSYNATAFKIILRSLVNINSVSFIDKNFKMVLIQNQTTFKWADCILTRNFK
jgi:hypothetical protein